MKPLYCPRCREPFERNERFCKTCGIRKGRRFSKWSWGLMALLIDLLLVSIFVGIREEILVSRGQPMDLSNGNTRLFFAITFISIGLPAICIYAVHFSLLLRRRGLITQGTVINNYTETIKRDDVKETREMSSVVFTPDIADPSECRVTTAGWLTIGSTVDVMYDPYNPGDYAQVGKGPSLAVPIVMIIIGLPMTAVVILMLVMILLAPLSVYS